MENMARGTEGRTVYSIPREYYERHYGMEVVQSQVEPLPDQIVALLKKIAEEQYPARRDVLKNHLVQLQTNAKLSLGSYDFISLPLKFFDNRWLLPGHLHAGGIESPILVSRLPQDKYPHSWFKSGWGLTSHKMLYIADLPDWVIAKYETAKGKFPLQHIGVISRRPEFFAEVGETETVREGSLVKRSPLLVALDISSATPSGHIPIWGGDDPLYEEGDFNILLLAAWGLEHEVDQAS